MRQFNFDLNLNPRVFTAEGILIERFVPDTQWHRVTPFKQFIDTSHKRKGKTERDRKLKARRQATR